MKCANNAERRKCCALELFVVLKSMLICRRFFAGLMISRALFFSIAGQVNPHSYAIIIKSYTILYYTINQLKLI